MKLGILLVALAAALSGCSDAGTENKEDQEQMPETETVQDEEIGGQDSVTEGTQEYRGFILDNVLHSESEGDIHYNLYVPDSYDGSRLYGLFLTLPGYEGLYFRGVGQNLYSEKFGFEAQKYVQDMIVVAPQLSGWDEHRQIRPLLLQSISLQTIISMSQECTGRDTREEARLCPL